MWDNVQANLASADRPAVTVYTVASRGERHTTRHTGQTPTRGRSARDRQLGRVQRKILRWLWVTEQRMMQFASAKDRRDLEVYGVPWVKVAEQIEERPSAVSEALRGKRQRSLSARDLVACTVDRRTHRVATAKLTPLGVEVARRLGAEGQPRLHIEREQERAYFVRLHGPPSGWSAGVRDEFRRSIETLESLILEDSVTDGDFRSFEGMHSAAIQRRYDELDLLEDLANKHPELFLRPGAFEDLYEAVFVTGNLDLESVREFAENTPEDDPQ